MSGNESMDKMREHLKGQHGLTDRDLFGMTLTMLVELHNKKHKSWLVRHGRHDFGV